MWDLGWLSKGKDWENHPWGSLARGYQIPAERYLPVRNRLRMLRLSLLLLCLAFFGIALLLKSFVPILVLLFFGCGLEFWATHRIFREFERTPKPMGLKAGLWYLSRFSLPYLMRACRYLNVLLMGLAFYLLWSLPRNMNSYLLVGIFVGVQFLLYYLEDRLKPS